MLVVDATVIPGVLPVDSSVVPGTRRSANRGSCSECRLSGAALVPLRPGPRHERVPDGTSIAHARDASRVDRKRGPDDLVFRPYDVRGQLLTEEGRELSPEGYLKFLSTVLPSKFIGSREYNKYVEQMREHHGLS